MVSSELQDLKNKEVTMSNKQKWARYGLIAFATMLLVIGTVVLGGMNNVNAAKHTHSYRWVVKKAATCTSEGYRNYECACGSCINSATIAKTPHTWDRGAATCTLPKKCRVCGTIGQAATGHNWNRSAASCTEDKKCRTCGTIGQRATGHSFQWVCTKAATCTTDGTKVNRCTKCSYICETQSIQHYGHH